VSIAPIVRRTHVRAPPERAFRLFTERMLDWWPARMTLGESPPVAIRIEPHAGGAWYQEDAAGHRIRWGSVLAWEPPNRLLLAWQLNAAFRYDPDLVTELELTFAAAPAGGTDVTLEHRNLERLGVDAARVADQLRNGWPTLVELFTSFADRTLEESRA
jgi:uncharacterized protein YndB with AHSA1/START domain